MGVLDGRTALVTGGAQGQGRAHAVTCVRGADVVIVDLADQIDTVPGPMGSMILPGMNHAPVRD